MSAQMGRNLLVKIGDGGSPQNFATVAGLRATTLAFNAQSIDITDNASTGMWRELLAGGIKSATISGNGVFKDAGSDETLRQAFFDQACPDFQIVIPGFGAVTGPFKITALQYDGPFDGEVKLSLTLASAGALAFTAV